MILSISEARYALEIRPILGWRFGPVDLLLNPIIDFPFHGGPGALTFAPADRIAYNLSETWALAVEHYADYGSFANFAALNGQYHALFDRRSLGRGCFKAVLTTVRSSGSRLCFSGAVPNELRIQ